MKSYDFGGASVTIPHKETIISLIDEVRGPAAIIGAVNTIFVEGNASNNTRRLIGCNTDWIGIQKPILRLLLLQKKEKTKKSNFDNKSVDFPKFNFNGIGLVIGAGTNQTYYLIDFCYINNVRRNSKSSLFCC
jgi:hypothetical protein